MINTQQFDFLVHILPLLEHADPELLHEFQEKAFFEDSPRARFHHLWEQRILHPDRQLHPQPEEFSRGRNCGKGN